MILKVRVNFQDTNLWAHYFRVLSAVFVAGGLVFLCFGSGEQQSWNEAVDENHHTKTEPTRENGTEATQTPVSKS